MTASLAPGQSPGGPQRRHHEKIAEGRHERFIIGNLARFLERAMQKARPTG